ncbi:peptidylprolyl isomerase [Pseudodesulfovibrio sp.]|nr:peptidylprolyl isomerase [Pseudodesulfovibrio sp.]
MNALKYGLCSLTLLCLLVAGMFSPLPAEATKPNPVVIFETSMGRIIVMLYPKQTPITVENFLRYVDDGFYSGTVFHRVVRMEIDKVEKANQQQAINIVQGGGFTYPPLRMKRPLWAAILNEDGRGLQNTKGTIAMARLSDPNSATCQFFFNVDDNPGLNPMVIKKKWSEPDDQILRNGYCAFGKVIRGMEIVEKIHQVPTTRMGNYQDVPKEPIYIKKAYRAK